MENWGQQHGVEALFWQELPSDETGLFEQLDADPSRFYILTVLREGDGKKPEIARKIWFDRADLRVSRMQLYGAAGRLESDITYSDWEPIEVTAVTGTATLPPHTLFARDLHIWRPQDDYRLGIRITKLTVNETISAD